jgi:hypothetical protein
MERIILRLRAWQKRGRTRMTGRRATAGGWMETQPQRTQRAAARRL